MIEYVHPAAFHPEPSLRGGDILLEWGEEDVTSAEQFRQLYDAGVPGDLVRYRVLRNHRRIAGGTVVPDAECRAGRPAAGALRVVGNGTSNGSVPHWMPRAARGTG